MQTMTRKAVSSMEEALRNLQRDLEDKRHQQKGSRNCTVSRNSMKRSLSDLWHRIDKKVISDIEKAMKKLERQLQETWNSQPPPSPSARTHTHTHTNSQPAPRKDKQPRPPPSPCGQPLISANLPGAPPIISGGITASQGHQSAAM